MPLEKRIFTTGMNDDDEERIIPPSSYRYALNIRNLSSDGQNIGAIETVKGNTLVSYTLPSGTNKVIGSYDDKTRNKVYYFVFNSLQQHSILEYTVSANTIAKVLQNSVLKLNKSFLITGINVVELDKDNHLLYWTDNNVEPRKINIEKAKLHSQGNFTLGYASPFLEHFIFRIKAPQPCEPSCKYGDDATKNINLLDKKLFQFKVQYVYDDFEKSATSPISTVPFPVLICGNNPTDSVNNKIDITVQTGSSIVKRILILAREGNEGDFFEIADLDKTLLKIASDTQFIHSFYNEKIYNTIEINESIKLFDSVPLKSQAQELIEGIRIADGNVLEGFDPVTPSAQLTLKLEDEVIVKTFSFSGFIMIANFFTNDFEYSLFQPIHNLHNTKNSNDPDETVFGGFSKVDLITNIGINADSTTKGYGQKLPLDGFTVFLVGTPYYAISRQVEVVSNPPDISQNGVFVSSTQGNTRARIRDAINSKSVYSKYTFSGVPAGKYSMRIASHLTTQADIDNGTFQKTSTNTYLVGGDNNHECFIEIKNNGEIKIGTLFTTQSGGQIPNSIVMDLSDPRVSTTRSTAITGYVTDKDIPSPLSTTQGFLADTRIELAKVVMNAKNTQVNNDILDLAATMGVGIFKNDKATEISSDLNAKRAFTDHNGYFYFTTISGLLTINLDVSSITSGANTIVPDARKFFDPSQTFVAPQATRMFMGIFRNPTGATGDALSNFSRTQITGKVLFNGLGVKGIKVTSTRGGTDTTLGDGTFGLIVYVDTRNGTQERKDIIIYNFSNNCIGVFASNQDNYLIQIGNLLGMGQIIFTPSYQGNYNNPLVNPFLVVIQSATILSILGAGSSISFKRGSLYQFGIVYYDHSNRSGLTNTNDNLVILNESLPEFITQKGLKLEIPFFTEINPNTTVIWGKSKPSISWKIAHSPPPFATHWQWVRTLNSVHNRYLQWTAKDVKYVDDDRNPTSQAAATKIGINIQNIANYKTRFGDSQVVFVPEPGDRIRFIKGAGQTFFSSYIDLVIRDIDPAGIAYIDNISTLPLLESGFLFEIYTPKLKGKSEIYFEFGQCFEVGNAGQSNNFHAGDGQANSQNQSFVNLNYTAYSFGGKDSVLIQTTLPHNLTNGTVIHLLNTSTGYSGYAIVVNVLSPTQIQTNLLFSVNPPASSGVLNIPATGAFSGGDTFSRIRSIPYGLPPGTPTEQAASSAYQLNWFIEDASFNDFFKSKIQDIGRPNKVDNTFKQITRKSTIFYSEKFIPETKINGLSSVFDTNFETYESQYGGIQKLFNQDLRLDCYQELKVGNIPVNQVEIQSTNVSGSSVVGTSAKVLNPIRYYQGEYGIGLNPESFAQYGGRRYFVDLNRGVAMRLSQDGLTVISDYKMHNFFTDKSKEILATGGRARIFGTYDVKFDEYIVAFESFLYSGAVGTAETQLVFPARTLAFNERNNAWSTFYSFNPEGMSTAGVDIVTFKDGKLFTHNSNDTYNNFYGVQFSSEIWIPVNGDPSKVKVLQAVSEESNEVWAATDITTLEGQSSNLITSDFELKEGVRYAAVLRDINTPNIVNPLIEGETMRSQSFLVKLKNSSTSFVKMFAFNGYWKNSERSNK